MSQPMLVLPHSTHNFPGLGQAFVSCIPTKELDRDHKEVIVIIHLKLTASYPSLLPPALVTCNSNISRSLASFPGQKEPRSQARRNLVPRPEGTSFPGQKEPRSQARRNLVPRPEGTSSPGPKEPRSQARRNLVPRPEGTSSPGPKEPRSQARRNLVPRPEGTSSPGPKEPRSQARRNLVPRPEGTRLVEA